MWQAARVLGSEARTVSDCADAALERLAGESGRSLVQWLREQRSRSHGKRNRRYRLTEATGNCRCAVVGCEELDGTIRLVYQERELVWQEVGERAPAVRPSRRVRATGSVVPHKPSADHPSRRRFLADRESESGSESAGFGVCCATRLM